MRKRPLVILLLLCCFACQTDKEEKTDVPDPATEAEIPFDKIKWGIQDGPDYPYRVQMYQDVLYNDTVRTLDKDQILNLLGEPNRTQEGHLYYMIDQKRLGPWPLHTKSLVIKLSEDSTVEWIKIHE